MLGGVLASTAEEQILCARREEVPGSYLVAVRSGLRIPVLALLSSAPSWIRTSDLLLRRTLKTLGGVPKFAV
jgi:hypothetical protein